MLTMVALLPTIMSGCVRRRMTIRTNPPGAAVYVDRQLQGPSPASTSFTYYGTRHIEVVSDGFRTEQVLRTFNPPWYQLPPLDFITETLWPAEIRDERVIDISMIPSPPVISEELQQRANNLRLQAAQGIATPLTPSGSAAPISAPATIYPANVNPPPAAPAASGWRPVQLLHSLIFPGGQAPQRIPEAGILPGGGLRPEIGTPGN